MQADKPQIADDCVIWQGIAALKSNLGKRLVYRYCTTGPLTLPPSLKEEVLLQRRRRDTAKISVKSPVKSPWPNVAFTKCLVQCTPRSSKLSPWLSLC